ncbi:uncharacterized protein PRCAT00000553001 [Priceomyces carsonii]|uniref:uncharacterized protein n=1 Tax=Priceomyces carsonii TaxID=28549 RepID=UPI002ED87AA0|nr:unnamed protein product [Priceomyces carsonii]
MASNPPGECCTKFELHEGTPVGKNKTLFGVDTYQVGQENGTDRVLVIFTDIYGKDVTNPLLIADQFAKSGNYNVLIPDILEKDPYDPNAGIELNQWLAKHPADKIKPFLKKYLATLRKEWLPKFVAGVGYCFGGKFVVSEMDHEGSLDAGAIAHPSFVTIDEVKALEKPILISAAEIDSIFTTELRHQTEAELIKLSESKGLRFQIDLFSGVSHGFSLKADLKNPAVKYAKEKVFCDQLAFFKQF